MVNVYKEKNTLELKELRENVTADISVGKTKVAMIDEILEERFSKIMLNRYGTQGKQHGIAKFKTQEGFTVVSEIKKTVKWDCNILQSIASKLKWSQVVGMFTITFKISEKNYKELPDELIAKVDTARSVMYSEPKITIED